MSAGSGGSLLGAELTSPAIVLGAVTTGESDRVVTLLTERFGKLAAVARGAQRSRLRFGAALAPLVLGEARLRERRGSDLYWLESFTSQQDFTGLAQDPWRWAQASYATELVRELSAARQPDSRVFSLLVECFATLGRVPPSADLMRAFELALLDGVGLRPVLERCLRCQRDDAAVLDDAGAMLDPERGGMLCTTCAPKHRGPAARPIDGRVRARLAGLQEVASLAEAAALPALPAALQAAARSAVYSLNVVHLARPLKTLEFVAQLTR